MNKVIYMKFLYGIIFCLFPLMIFSQDLIKPVLIEDTLEFEGLFVLDARNTKFFLLPKEELKEINVFNISRRKLDKLETKGKMYPYLQSVDCRDYLLTNANFLINDAVGIEPICLSNPIGVSNEEIDIAVVFITMQIVKLSVDIDFLKEYISSNKIQLLTENNRAVIYTYVGAL